MAGRRNESQVVKVAGQGPAWLTPDLAGDKSLQAMKQYRVLQRVKVVQGSARGELKRRHGEGSAVLSPVGHLLCVLGGSFDFVPLIFYREFCKWSDIRDTSGLTVRERTQDETQPLARLCRDPDTREVEYEGGPKDRPFKFRHVEHLCFAGVVYGGELEAQPLVVNFSRGEFRTGCNFVDAIFMRRIPGTAETAPLWTQCWTLTPVQRERGGYSWYGLDYSTPERGAWIDEADVAPIRALHSELQRQLEQNQIRTDYSEHDDAVVEEDDQELEMQ